MEPTGNKPMPENPQPQDEVQLHIETVTPETERVTPPTDTIEPENSKDQAANPEDSKDLAATETPDDNQDIDEENPAAVEDNKGGGEPGDARDEVETVSP